MSTDLGANYYKQGFRKIYIIIIKQQEQNFICQTSKGFFFNYRYCILLLFYLQFQLPLDLSLLSEEEKKMRLDKRKPKKKVKIMDDIQDDFNAKKYLKYMKKK